MDEVVVSTNYVGEKYLVTQEKDKAVATRSEWQVIVLGDKEVTILYNPVRYTSLFDAMQTAAIDGDKAFSHFLVQHWG